MLREPKSDEDYYLLFESGQFAQLSPQKIQSSIYCTALITYLQNMDVTAENIYKIRVFIQVHKFPVLILLREFYSKMSTLDKEVYSENLSYMSQYTKKFLEEQHFQELVFFRHNGPISKKKIAVLKKQPHQREFFQYIHTLSSLYCEVKNSQNIEEQRLLEIKSEFDKILSSKKFQFPDLNKLQNNYIKTITSYFEEQYENRRSKVQISKLQPLLEEAIQVSKNQIEPIPKFVNYYNPFQFDEKKHPKEDSFFEEGEVSEIVLMTQKLSQVPLCCRKFFVLNQYLHLVKIPLIFENYKYPFSTEIIFSLHKNICSLLNSKGGMIFIGVKKYPKLGNGVIKGLILSEQMKIQITKIIEDCYVNIEPKVNASKNLLVEFVPLKAQIDANYLAGKFLIRVKVKPGVRDEMYSFKFNNKEYFYARNQSEGVYQIAGRRILAFFSELLKKPRQRPGKIHEGECYTADKGLPIAKYDSSFYTLGQITSDFLIYGYKIQQIKHALFEAELSNSIEQISMKHTGQCYLVAKETMGFNRRIWSLLKQLDSKFQKKVVPVFHKIRLNYEEHIERANKILQNFQLFYSHMKERKEFIFNKKKDAGIAYIFLTSEKIPCTFQFF